MSSNGKFAIFTIFCIAVTCQLSSALTVPSSLQNRRLNHVNHLNPNDLKNTKLQYDNVLYPFALWVIYFRILIKYFNSIQVIFVRINPLAISVTACFMNTGSLHPFLIFLFTFPGSPYRNFLLYLFMLPRYFYFVVIEQQQ